MTSTEQNASASPSSETAATGPFRVTHDARPHGKKREPLSGKFKNRQKARQFCKNRMHQYFGLRIIWPDGTEECFQWDGATQKYLSGRT